MARSTWIGMAWLAAALAACGGTSGGEGGGGAGTTTTSSAEALPPEGIHAAVDGVEHAWMNVSLIEYTAKSEQRVTFVALDDQAKTEIHLGPPKPFLVGTYPCDGTDSQIWYQDHTTGGDWATSLGPEEQCNFTFTQVPAAKGERWVGTFSGVLPDFNHTSSVAVTNGTINVVY